MRLAGAVGIMLCALMTGLELRRRTVERVRILDEMCELCRLIASGVRFERRPLTSIVLRMPEAMKFASVCAERLKNEEDFHSAWRNACGACSSLRLLERRERELILSLGESLGRSDVQGELELLSACGDSLAQARDEARRELPGRSKLCLSCSLLAGMMTAVILL